MADDRIHPANVPIRTSSIKKGQSSKRDAPSSETDDYAERRAKLQKRSTLLDDEINEKESEVKLEPSSSAPFWIGIKELSRLRHERNEVQKKLSLIDFQIDGGGDMDGWLKTGAARDLLVKGEAFQLRGRITSRHSTQMRADTGPPPPAWRRMMMQLFASSRLGLNLDRVVKPRERIQSKFRKALEKAGDCKNPDKQSDSIWCAVTGRYWPGKDATKAAHIFPASSGRKMFADIFSTDGEELFFVHNGMIMCGGAEERFDKYLLALVPDLRDNATSEEIDQWMNAKAPDYKVKLFDHGNKALKKYVQETAAVDPTQTWLDLDGKKVDFKTGHRPRRRYLYFHYICCILRRLWSQQLKAEAKADILVKESSKVMWGTVGTYFKTSMLRYFVMEVGHEWRSVFADAGHHIPEVEDPTEQDLDPSLLWTTASFVGATKVDEDVDEGDPDIVSDDGNHNDDEEEEDEDEDDDEEER